MFNKIKNFIKSHKIISVVALFIVLLLLWKIVFNGGSKTEDFAVVKMNLSQKVIVTGKIKPTSDATLAFEKSGKISRVYAPIGSKVYSGQSLISLDSSAPYADYLKAQANLEVEKAQLEKMKKGGTVEEIALKQTELENSKRALINAENNLSSKLEDSFVKADDAVRNNIDQFFINPKSSNPQINIYVDSTQLKNDINQGRFEAENLLNVWSATNFSPTKDNIDMSVKNLNTIKSFLDKVAVAINALTPNSSISQTAVDAYKADVSLARSNIATAQNNVLSAEEKFNSGKSAVSVSERSLDLAKNPKSPEDIKSQEARILQFQAEMERTSAELSKYTLKSPINGTVVKQDAVLGETVTVGANLVTVISEGFYEIEANVSEVSIGKISIGNSVRVNMDAFASKTFYGKVSYIEPGETIVDGVVNYKVKIIFDEKYPEIKTGLTANLEIQTINKEGVLAIPDYAITRKEEKSYVMKKNNKRSIETEVVTGIVGSEGFTEIISGLSEGDIVEFVVSNK